MPSPRAFGYTPASSAAATGPPAGEHAARGYSRVPSRAKNSLAFYVISTFHPAWGEQSVSFYYRWEIEAKSDISASVSISRFLRIRLLVSYTLVSETYYTYLQQCTT